MAWMHRVCVLLVALVIENEALTIFKPIRRVYETKQIPRIGNGYYTLPRSDNRSTCLFSAEDDHDVFCFSFNRSYEFHMQRNIEHLLAFAVAVTVSFFALPANALMQPTTQHQLINTVQANPIHAAYTTSLSIVDIAPSSSISHVSLPKQNDAITTHLKTIYSIGKIKEFKRAISSNVTPQSISNEDVAKPPSLPTPPVFQTLANTQKIDEKKTSDGDFQPIDVKKIAVENKIEVELQLKDQSGTVKIDRETFQKVKTVQPKFLQYLPSSMQPLISQQFQSLQVLKEIPDDQLFEASVLAGAVTEMIRSTLTYPLSTVKARVQSRRSMSIGRKGKGRSLFRKLKVTWLTFVFEMKRGNLFAGILPTLLITIPASGVYSGVKEVSRRAIVIGIQSQVVSSMFTDDSEWSSYVKVLSVNLLSSLIADVASLAARTPADVLALRRQVFGRSNVRSDYTDWAKDSVLLLPAMIITDLPYLMSRIFLNAAITTSGENLGRYEFDTIIVACLCAFLTTPFDVARTRILLPSLPSEETAAEKRLAGSSKFRSERRQKLSVLSTMKRVSLEGNGGVQNLFAGWLERTVFLGLGRAWLDPLRVIGYLGLRDAILLKLFD